MSENIILVDENDREVGAAEKLFAHKEALLHRAFSIFVYREVDGEIEILLQKRQQDKYHCGGLWTNTCCSHPRLGEDIEAAAHRRLQEEMGFMLLLVRLGHFHYTARFDNGLTENEIDHVFIGKYTDQAIKPNPEEVEDYKWMTLPQLEASLRIEPQSFTPWLAKALQLAKSELHDT